MLPSVYTAAALLAALVSLVILAKIQPPKPPARTCDRKPKVERAPLIGTVWNCIYIRLSVAPIAAAPPYPTAALAGAVPELVPEFRGFGLVFGVEDVTGRRERDDGIELA